MTTPRHAILLALVSAVLPFATANAADLAVDLSGVRAQTGHLQVALVDSEDGWNNRAKPIAAQAVAPAGSEARVVFEDLAPGRYAVLVMHDENDNGKLDTNLVGMPIEGYGFSNNPQVMRKPTWDESRFDLGDDALSITIDLR